ncbi:PREDICTED: LOW QUALITY PROTEIN: 28S ribosomal protein S29, mitochondrial [Nanorana parkeri]|uniref:LOW QUALITY PROTEIN: 28S ribosomal protein S29, mitochondrial n=1 Tax=Nanorana parkeri TaxID=125878 RepID=UPI000854F6F2|nr:PREDICTED: LOW QUALITY PROTEIN: 28S ribosomal protein S29, mitochondrial [Nanorana parkeri]
MLMKCLHRSAWKLVFAPSVPRRGLSSLASPAESPNPREVFRTSESDPANHTEDHEAQFYSVPSSQVRSTFPHGLPSRYQLQCKTFSETCLMVRQPALELIDYLKKTDFSQPAVRYVLYGKPGTGKSLILCHVLHFCHTQGWLMVHLPDAHLLVKNCKELMASSYNKERYDQPLEASAWLKHFKVSNEQFLSQVVTQQRYVWSKREATEEGTPLGAVVDHGLSRVKTASDVVGVVLKELKRQSGGDAFRILVSMDGANSLWGRTSLKKENRINLSLSFLSSQVSPEELTLVHNFRKMVKNDWTGGAVVLTVSQTGSLFNPKSAYLPHALLGKEGFDFLDPFIPIQVTKYSEKEFESCYQYYVERKWIQHEKARTEQGKTELMFLSSSNPREMEKICTFL